MTTQVNTSNSSPAVSKNGDNLKRILTSQEFILFLLFVIEVAIFFVSVPVARKSKVYFDLLREISPNLIAVIGIGLLMIGGEFDLSVGAVMAAAGVVMVSVMNMTGSILLGVVAGALIGPVIGMLLGYLVTKHQMSSLMTSLGLMFALRGFVYVSTNKQSVMPAVSEETRRAFYNLFQPSVGDIPIPGIVAIILVVIWILISTQTVFGRKVYAVGGNANAAQVSGIQAGRIKMIYFILAGTMSAIAGVLMASNTGSGYYDTGQGFELMIVTAVVLGGISLEGGEGSLLGAVLGVLILGVSSKAMRMMAVVTTTQLVITGVIMMLAVYLHGLRKRLLAKQH